MKIILAIILIGFACPANAWWEAASTWDPKRGRYVSTEEYKKDHHLKEVCQSASCWDGKSGQFLSGEDWNKREEERNKVDQK